MNKRDICRLEFRCKGAILPVLAVALVIASAMMMVFTQGRIEEARQARTINTLHKIEIIQAALDVHLSHKGLGQGDYPCAAPIDLQPADEAFGRESDACENAVAPPTPPTCGNLTGTNAAWLIPATPIQSFSFISKSWAAVPPPPAGIIVNPPPSDWACSPSTSTTPPCPGPNCVWIGFVPTRTLNLPDDYIFDEWGNPFTYAVTSVSAQGSALFDVSNGKITVKKSNNIDDHTTRGHFVVISHGPDGIGAFGSDDACNTATPEQEENCDLDRTFVDGDFEIVDPKGEVGDFVVWR